MWYFIIILIIVLIIYGFYSDTKKVQKRNIALGGLKTLFPKFVDAFESMDMELAEDSGTRLLYKKKMSNNTHTNKYLYLALESKFEHIAYGYVINPDGSKINGLNVVVYNNHTTEEVEMTLRKIIVDLEMRGAL